MDVDPADLAPADRYKLLIGAIVPRPIALVSTLSPAGAPNLAPFSFFNGVGSTPMLVSFCPANTDTGEMKDTLRNAQPISEGGTGEFVVNIVSHAMAHAMASCAEPLGYGQSEWALSGFTPEPSVIVKPPRVSVAPVALECVTERVLRFAPGTPGGANMVIGRVVRIFAREGIVNDRHHVDPALLDAIGRLGGLGYCTTRDRLEIPMGIKALDASRRPANP